MKVGDLIIRKIPAPSWDNRGCWKRQGAIKQLEDLGPGIIISKQMKGNPSHPCVTVFYPKPGKTWDIAESLIEVIA